jgi:hypothetical protein
MKSGPRRGLTTVSALLLMVAAVLAATTLAGRSGEDRSAGKPLHASPNFDPTIPGWVACSRLIVEGDVLRVRDVASPGRMVTELAVHGWVKPGSGPTTARIETVDIAGEGVYRRWPAGTHLFLRVDVDPSALPDWQFGHGEMKRIEQAVPASRSIECPYGPA